MSEAPDLRPRRRAELRRDYDSARLDFERAVRKWITGNGNGYWTEVEGARNYLDLIMRRVADQALSDWAVEGIVKESE